MSQDGFRPDLVTVSEAALEEIRNILRGQGIVSDEELEQPMGLRCGLPEFSMDARCAWPQKVVTYSHRMAMPGIDAATVSRIFRQACDSWNAVCGVRLTFTDDFDTANIYANSGKIDGSGGTLAWSYLPCGATNTSRLEQLYDNKENWSVALLLNTILHEIGHGLGLPHSTRKDSIMYAFANAGITTLQEWDITEGRARYGPPSTVPVPIPPIVPVPLPPVVPTPGGGQGAFSIDGRVLELTGRWVA